MKFILLVSLILHNISQNEHNVIYTGQEVAETEIAEGLKISDIIYPSEGFSNLRSLGPVLSKECNQSFVEEVCVLRFENLEITYKNINGTRELASIEFSNNGTNVMVGKSPVSIGGELSVDQSKARSTLEIRENVYNDGEKFGAYYDYLQVTIDPNNTKVLSIKYVRSLI